MQDVRNPFADVQDAPLTRTDARHRVAMTSIVEAPFGITIAPILLYQSALPTHSFEGLDLNTDGAVDAKDVTLFQRAVSKGAVEAPPLAYHSSLPCDYRNFFIAAAAGARSGGTVPVHFLNPRFNLQNSSVTVQSGPATVTKTSNAYLVKVAKSAPANSSVTVAITFADNKKYSYTFLVHQ